MMRTSNLDGADSISVAASCIPLREALGRGLKIDFGPKLHIDCSHIHKMA